MFGCCNGGRAILREIRTGAYEVFDNMKGVHCEVQTEAEETISELNAPPFARQVEGV
jgi:hypothetical protein